jgi:signal transduction histidine kinase
MDHETTNLAAEISPAKAVIVRAQLSATERLVEAAQELSIARDLTSVMTVVRRAARELTAADGATFVLREGDLCFYADENAISPLWKGRSFPMSDCISGWAMLNREAAVIEDIYADPRIPHDAYRPTFVASLAMVPIRTSDPCGAIGNYWAKRHRASDGEVKLLRALADLTSVALENVQLYAELQKRIVAAEEALRTREEFISVAAHELRTPLTAMLLQLERLEQLSSQKNSADAERLHQSASRAVGGAHRLAALVDGLLDASRLPHGRLELKLETLDLVQAARDVLEAFSDAAERAKCKVVLHAGSVVQCRCDPVRIRQVLTHLLSNALKYGEGKPIDISIEAREATAHVAIRDHGVGIDPKIADRIFERFGRAGPIAHYGGLGFGLYLARAIIDAHGGAIRFESKRNEGSTFMFDLPLGAH